MQMPPSPPPPDTRRQPAPFSSSRSVFSRSVRRLLTHSILTTFAVTTLATAACRKKPAAEPPPGGPRTPTVTFAGSEGRPPRVEDVPIPGIDPRVAVSKKITCPSGAAPRITHKDEQTITLECPQ